MRLHSISLHVFLAKVLYKPHLVTGRCETGKSKSAIISPYSRFQKKIHDGTVSGSWLNMDMLLILE